MNSLKPLLVVAVLAAVAYGVYTQINRSPQVPEDAPAWPPAPAAQIPGPQAAVPQMPAADSEPGPPVGNRASTPPPFALPNASATPVATLPQGTLPQGTLPQGVAPPYRSTGDAPAPPSATPPSATPPSATLPSATLPSATPVSPDAGRAMGSLRQQSNRDRFDAFMRAVQVELDKGNLAEALQALSSWHGHPDLPVEQTQQLTDLLDQLAGTVIYSRQHLLEPPYKVQPGDTIDQIERSYDVPWQLIARINGIPEDQPPQPGQELKVVRGPFKALIDLENYELTLMLDGRYAGRFPIGIGRDHEKLEGTYVVREKLVNPQYYGTGGITVDADDPNNPLGEFWIGLSQQNGRESTIGIHGTNDPRNLHRRGGYGSICLGDQDINDLHGILSIGSRVVIRR